MEHANKGPALRFMERVRAGEVEACTSTEVLQEILWRYHALGRVDRAAKVYDLFVVVVPVVLPVTLADTDLARDLLASTGGISARDAVHAAVMLTNDLDRVATFDRGFDRVGRVTRLDLGE